MQKITDEATQSQAVRAPEPPKHGIEVVKSAFLPRRCFLGSRPYRRHYYPANDWMQVAKAALGDLK